MSDVEPEVTPLATTPPTILASSVLSQVLKPRHASIATQSETKQLAKQTARRQLRQQERRTLPVTEVDFYARLSQ